MAEIKHNFAGGKMNKDVDERLVPNGEYRDAMNIQVSTSEGGEVGAVENLLSNESLQGNSIIQPASTCIGSIADEKNDALYWLVTNDAFESAFEGTSPDIHPVQGGNYQGQLTWPTHLVDIGGLPQTIFSTNDSFGLSRKRINGIYELKQEVITPVFIDEAGTTIVIQSGNPGGLPPTKQLEIANSLSTTPLTQSFIGSSASALGYDPTGSKMFEVFDGAHIKIGDRLEMWGYNPWTQQPQNFLEGYKDKINGIIVLNKTLVSTWITNDGELKEHYILHLSESIYTSHWDELEKRYYPYIIDPAVAPSPSGVTYGGYPQNGFKIYTNFLVTHINFVSGVLNFSPKNLITGINIIDDMLFWTDNASEPKKINIPNSIKGTDPSGLIHTNFLNIESSQILPAEEKHITVIKKSPKNVLTVETEDTPLGASGVTANNLNFLVDPALPSLGNKGIGQEVDIVIFYDSSSTIPVDLGEILLLKDATATILPPNDSTIAIRLTQYLSSHPNGTVPGMPYAWKGNIISIADEGVVGTASVQYAWSLRVDTEQKFLEKFPRFSYRYKYKDGEYSAFGPFTNPIFSPGPFVYDVKDAFNLGMENRVSTITLKDYSLNLPEDVVKIDLLYKDSNSPTVHLIDTIDFNSLEWSNLSMGYEVKPNMVRAILPENQSLRHWDNVPRKALAQTVTGSRIIYGNYLQNYSGDNYKISALLTNRNDCDYSSNIKSLKSIRNYSLGISYLDQYGRQTPVFTNKAADLEVDQKESINQNQIIAQPLAVPPTWATHYKVFIKETSNEYYNLAMDRIYDARDGNIWLSFPSSDRNKVDEETFLILKKGIEDFAPVTDKNRYKILAIENEAPEFIKTKLQIMDQTSGAPNGL